MERLTIVTILVVGVIVISGQASLGEIDENSELRTMLRQTMAMFQQSMDLNRELQQYMDELRPVWTDLQSVCNGISAQCCQCKIPEVVHVNAKEESSKKVSAEWNTSNEEESNDKNDRKEHWFTRPPIEETHRRPYRVSERYPLKILSVKSEGELENSVAVTVYYTALESHATQWIIYYERFNMRESYRTGGTINTTDTMHFSTSVLIEQVDLILDAYLEIYSGNEIVRAVFDISALLQMKGIQDLHEYKADILDMNDTYTAPRVGSYWDLTLIMDDSFNISAIPYFQAELAWIDTSDQPPGLYYTSYNTYNTFDSIGQSSDIIVYVTIEAGEEHVQRGGVLEIWLPWTPDSFNTIKQIKNGVFLNVLTSENNEVYPKNTVGMYRWYNITMLVSPKQSLFCLARGYPPPEVDIYQTLPDGRRKELITESMRPNVLTSIVLYQLSPEDRGSPGNYTCRAQSGSTVLEESTEVILYTPVKFDATRTGVMKNTTKKIVFSCKASGSIRPTLEFRLYGQDGPNLQKCDRCKVKEDRSSGRTTALRLVVSPPDYDIHTVVCVALTHYMREFRTIELFPGTYRVRNLELEAALYAVEPIH